MKKILFTSLLASCMAFLTFSTSFADEWQNSAQKVLQLAGDMDARTALSKKYANQDRAQLEARVKALKASIAVNEQSLKKAQESLNTVSAQRAAMADSYQAEMADMKTMEGAFRSAVRESVQRLALSPVTAINPEKYKEIGALVAQERFLGIEGMQEYTAYLFDDIEATATIVTETRPVVTVSGAVQDVPVTRAGGFFLGYLEGGDGYYAVPQKGSSPEGILPSSATVGSLTAWLAGEEMGLPLDITGGAAIRAEQQKGGWGEWMEAGGVLLYPILLAGALGALIALLKAVQLFMASPISAKKREELVAEAAEGMASIEKSRYSSEMLAARLCAEKGATMDRLDNIVEEFILVEEGRLGRFLSVIGVLASIAPLLGLLGTVTGMIDTFQTITIFGTSDPRLMSTGISEALITTQAGLAIAIPLLLVHHFLKRRLGMLIDDMESTGAALVAKLGR